MAALTFCYDTLRTGGHFVCKYYQGNEEKDLELRLKKLFEKVHREKPESSRNVRVPLPYHIQHIRSWSVDKTITRPPELKRAIFVSLLSP